MEKNPLEQFSFLVLAGGGSRRMGTDKAELPWQGTTLLEWQLQKARELGVTDILAAGYRGRCSCPTVQDVYPRRGPLGGLHTGLLHANRADCIVVGVDCPLVPGELLREMALYHRQQGAEATVLTYGGRIEPLIAVYKTALAPQVAALIEMEPVAVRALLGQVTVREYPFCGDPALLHNCNTPEEYAALPLLAPLPRTKAK